MKWLSHFILSHSVFIAFCAAALSLQTMELLSIPINGYLIAFIFFATLGGYNAYWLTSRISFNKYASITSFLQKSRSAIFVILAAVTGMIFCLSNLQLVLYNIIITLILLFIYSMPVLPFRHLYFTRKAGYLKTIILAVAWTIVTILIPLQISIPEMKQEALLIFVNRFLFMLMLCIIFDKRDAAVDKIRGLQSMATNIKPRLLHYLMGFIFICYVWTSFLLKSNDVTAPQASALIITGLTTLFVYYCSLQKRGYFFYYFGVDGLMFLSALLTWIAGFF